MPDDQYVSFKYEDLAPHKICLARRDGCLLVTLASSGGQENKARYPGRNEAFERLLDGLLEHFLMLCSKAFRENTLRLNGALRHATLLEGPVATHRDALTAARNRGGANRFDVWLTGIPDTTLDQIASMLGLTKLDDQRSQPEPLPPLTELLPPTGLVTAETPRRIALPKSFVLLAGLSGTGKTSFVRDQAARMGAGRRNFELIPVRPDWHEPSELFGHITRIHGERFVATPFLKFIASAWREAAISADREQIKLHPLDEIATFWACLDEMNLAPVEQYLADYLSVLETRSWKGDLYTSEAILPLHRLGFSVAVLSDLREQLELSHSSHDGLWQHFLAKGVPLPPNLVVAGTVNMDETTHGFSRKVIDRAFTLDFGAFFPTEFGDYFEPANRAATFTFPRRSKVSKGDLSECCDPEGERSIAFLEGVNGVLRHTTFELAYRALNELLLAVQCFTPRSDDELRAVWDDFLMTKVLPRLEGDAEKLNLRVDTSLLTELGKTVRAQLGTSKRPDLFRFTKSGNALSVELRSPQALTRMHERLTRHNFTSFWP